MLFSTIPVRSSDCSRPKQGRMLAMRRLLSVFLNIVTALLLVLSAATVVLWVRSYWVSDACFFSHFDHDGPWVRWVQVTFRAGDGGVGVFRSVQFFPREIGAGLESRHQRIAFQHVGNQPAYPDFRFDESQPVHGFNFGHFANAPQSGGRPGSTGLQIIAPLWAVLLASTVCAVAGVWRWRWVLGKRSRQFAGLCAACGYDMRVTPDRCPECGATRPRHSGGAVASPPPFDRGEACSPR